MRLSFKNEYINRAIFVIIFNVALSLYSLLVFSIYEHIVLDLPLQYLLKIFFNHILGFVLMPFIGSFLLFSIEKIHLLIIYHIGDILFSFYILYPKKILLYLSILINIVRWIFLIFFVYLVGKYC